MSYLVVMNRMKTNFGFLLQIQDDRGVGLGSRVSRLTLVGEGGEEVTRTVRGGQDRGSKVIKEKRHGSGRITTAEIQLRKGGRVAAT